MAMQLSSRSLFSKALISSLLSRTVSSCPLPPSHHPLSLLRTALRPLSSAVAIAATSNTSVVSRSSTTHFFSTRATSSSLSDPSPNWSNRPPKETILLDGCDFEHWLVVLEKPDESMTRDDIIDSYIKTLAKIVGSEEEARMKIYSVSTKHYFAFGALVSEELSNKIKELPGVRWVLPDSYLDVRNKDYGGEPFINGQAVPYDPKYHEEWVRNNAKANDRNRRNDRPRQNDRSRNFERRRENMQSRDGMGGPVGMPPAAMGAPGGLPPGNTGGYVAPPPRGMGGPPPGNMGGYGPPSGPPPGNMGGYGPSSGPPPGNMGGHGAPSVPPTGNMGGYGPPPPNGPGGNMGGYRGPSPPPSGMGGQSVPPYGGPQHNNYGPGIPQNNHGGMHQGFGGAPSNPGWSNNVPGNTQNFQNNANGGGGPQDYQNGYSQFK